MLMAVREELSTPGRVSIRGKSHCSRTRTAAIGRLKNVVA